MTVFVAEEAGRIRPTARPSIPPTQTGTRQVEYTIDSHYWHPALSAKYWVLELISEFLIFTILM